MSDYTDEPIVLPAPLPVEPQGTGRRESRAQVRFPFTAAAEIYEIHSQTRVTGRCSDLSSGGCYIDTLTPLAVGSNVRLRIEREMHVFEATAVVAYAHIALGMGLAFTEMKDEHRELLSYWISELSGEKPCEPAPSILKPETGAVDTDANMRLVLNELIYLLVHKKILAENEATELLHKMFC